MKERNDERAPDPISEHTEHTARFMVEEERKKAEKKLLAGPPGHTAEVISDGSDGFLIVCSCGWKITDRVTKVLVDERFAAHLKEIG